MSSIAFHSQHGTARLRGSERAYAGVLAKDLALAVLRPWYTWDSAEHPAPIRAMLPPNSYISRLCTPGVKGFERSFESWFSGGLEDTYLVLPGDRRVATWDIQLNTAHRLGSDAVKLLVRLHAQSEIHCYVEGPDRAWLADLITRGRAQKILRPDQGWEDVATLLALRDDEPVVCSYSVCESFPNPGVAIDGVQGGDLPWVSGDPDWDTVHDLFYDLDEAERWEYAMAGLRYGSKSGLQISEAQFYDATYGSTVTAFDIDEILTALQKRMAA